MRTVSGIRNSNALGFSICAFKSPTTNTTLVSVVLRPKVRQKTGPFVSVGKYAEMINKLRSRKLPLERQPAIGK